MSIKQKEENQLGIVFPPGDFIAEWFEDQNMTVKEFARLCNKPEKEIQEIIDGGYVSPSMAITLEKVTKMPARLWNELQNTFDSYIRRLAKEKERELMLAE